MSPKHESLIKTPKQLIVVVILAFVVPIAVVVAPVVPAGATGAGTGRWLDVVSSAISEPTRTIAAAATATASRLRRWAVMPG